MLAANGAGEVRVIGAVWEHSNESNTWDATAPDSPVLVAMEILVLLLHRCKFLQFGQETGAIEVELEGRVVELVHEPLLPVDLVASGAPRTVRNVGADRVVLVVELVVGIVLAGCSLVRVKWLVVELVHVRNCELLVSSVGCGNEDFPS